MSESQESSSEANADRLRNLVAAVAASHSRCCQEDVEAVLEMALHGSGLAAPDDDWVTQTAAGISSGSIMPITSRRGLDFHSLLQDPEPND